MSKLNSVIFIDNLPRLDLHGFDRDTARLYINDFIKENQKLKNEFILIIHGIGSGIIKDEIGVLVFKTRYNKLVDLRHKFFFSPIFSLDT